VGEEIGADSSRDVSCRDIGPLVSEVSLSSSLGGESFGSAAFLDRLEREEVPSRSMDRRRP
jgi:hypothetical protein